MNLKKYYLPIALVGLALTFSAMLSKADPLDVGAASVVSLGRNGTSTYLLYPTDTFSAANYNATSTTATSTFANGIKLTGGCFAIGSVCLPTTSASSTLLSDANTWSGVNVFPTITTNSTTATSTFAGDIVVDDLMVGTSTRQGGGVNIGLGKRLNLWSNYEDDDGEILTLNNLSTTTKTIIAFKDYTGATKTWIANHLYSSAGVLHKHTSIESSDVAGQLQTRLAFPYDCDYDCDMSVNQSNLKIQRNTGKTNGNLFIDGGYVGASAALSIYPYRASNGTYALQISTSTANNPLLRSVGASILEIDDTLQVTGNGYISGSLGVGTTSPLNQFTIEKSGASGVTVGPTIELRQNQTSINTTQNSTLGEILFSGADILAGETGVGAKIRGEATGIWNGTTNDYPTSLRFFTNPNGSGALAEQMVITDAGLIGIGTTSPYAKLSVVGETVSAFFTATTTSVNTFPNLTATNATSTNLHVSTGLTGTRNSLTGLISPVKHLSYITATTTAWTATTSGAYLPPIISPFAGTIHTAQCSTDAGTLNVDIYHTTTHLTLFNASTTVGTVSFSSNNTVTNGEKIYIAAGTPASSPTVLSCTLSLTETP